MLTVLALLCAGAVALIGGLTVRGHGWWALDQRWSHRLFDVGHRHQTLTSAAEWVGHLTVPTVLRVITLVGAVVLWRRGWRREAVWWSLTMIISGAVAIGLRNVVARPRPHWPGSGPIVEGYTFPSGHATSAAVFAGCVLVVFWPHLRPIARVGGSVVAVAFLVAVGVSRLLLGVHRVGDVVAAWALAAALLLFAGALGPHRPIGLFHWPIRRPHRPDQAFPAGGGRSAGGVGRSPHRPDRR